MSIGRAGDHGSVIGAQLHGRDVQLHAQTGSWPRAAGRWPPRRRPRPGGCGRSGSARRTRSGAPRRSPAGRKRPDRRGGDRPSTSPRSRTLYSSAVFSPAKEKSSPGSRVSGGKVECLWDRPPGPAAPAPGRRDSPAPAGRAPLSNASPAASSSVSPSTSHPGPLSRTSGQKRVSPAGQQAEERRLEGSSPRAHETARRCGHGGGPPAPAAAAGTAASALAVSHPTSRAPPARGPGSAATRSISSRPMPAWRSASSTTGPISCRWWREAISGTIPP